QGVGLAVAREITEQYAGQIIASDSLLGGARMEVVFGRQHPTQRRKPPSRSQQEIDESSWSVNQSHLK
ncbi:hypothetical protein ONO84_24900, partial [Salmonella enterica subsp. enterica serovar Virginia]|nr:hypothetical protein [Salmonella enterica subsp. enterica serovar Virginia]